MKQGIKFLFFYCTEQGLQYFNNYIIFFNQVQTKSRALYCSNRAAQWAKIRHDQCENLAGLQLVSCGSAPILGYSFEDIGGLEAAKPGKGWSNIIVPGKK